MPGFIDPIAEYDHSTGRCSITGGYVYRGTRGTLPLGTYVYGDFCSGEILSLRPVASGATQALLLDTELSISSFGEDETGEIYVVGLGGTVHRISAGAPPPSPGVNQKNSSCFIATAAFGSPLAPEVEALRRFRGRFLMSNAPGRAFVAVYYRASPPGADLIRGHRALRALTRFALRPVIWGARLTETSPASMLALLITVAGGSGLFCYGTLRRWRTHRAPA